MKKKNLLNIGNYIIDNICKISVDIQLKIILENEYNLDIICIQTINNFLFKKVLNILKDITYNYYYTPNIKYLRKDKKFNLITLSKFKILNYSYYYEENNNINFLITKVCINKNKYSIINTHNIYSKQLKTLIINEYNNSKIKNVLIFGLSSKKIKKYLNFIKESMSYNYYNNIFLKNNIIENISLIMKNKILLIKYYNINDKLLSKKFYKLILFLY